MTELVKSVRDELVTNLAGITGMGVYPYINTGVPLPCIWVYPDTVDFDESVGTDTRNFIVEARLGNVSEQSSQENADLLMGNGAQSIKKALDDPGTTITIGAGEWQTHVSKCSGYRYDASETLTVQWTVEISAPNEDT